MPAERRLENCCSGAPLAIVLSAVCALAVPVTFSTNIYFLADIGAPNVSETDNGTYIDILALSNSSNPEDIGLAVAYVVTFVSLLYEIAGLAFSGFVCLCCIFPKTCNIVRTLAVQRGVILYFAVIFVPLSHTYFFVLGEPRWYVLMVYRLFFYGIVFASTAITGIGWKDETINITSWSHLFKITWILLQICLKLMSCSSALASYLTVGITQDLPIRVSYFAFSIHRGLTALFTFGANTLLLRFAVQDHETPRNKWDKRIQHCVQKWEAHVHISGWNDLISYGGLIVLNIHILADGKGEGELIANLCFSLFGVMVTAIGYIFCTKFCGKDPIGHRLKQKVQAIQQRGELPDHGEWDLKSTPFVRFTD